MDKQATCGKPAIQLTQRGVDSEGTHLKPEKNRENFKFGQVIKGNYPKEPIMGNKFGPQAPLKLN